MQLLNTVAVCALLVAGVRSESEPLISSSLYKDGHHDYIQQFHHGQSHGTEGVQGGANVGHLVPNSPIQDQTQVQDQVGHSSVGHVGQGPSAVSPVNQLGALGAAPAHVGPILPVQYIGQKSEVPIHAARAIGGPVPVPYYPYYGKTYASPVYGQYQPVQQQGVYQQVYPYNVNPYSATPYSAVPLQAPVYPGYPGYNHPYYPQYFPGVPSYYHQQANEVQSVKQ